MKEMTSDNIWCEEKWYFECPYCSEINERDSDITQETKEQCDSCTEEIKIID